MTFLTRPYSPNDAARLSATQGTVPPATASTVTAPAPSPTATHWVTRSRSLKITTPSSTLTSGLMK